MGSGSMILIQHDVCPCDVIALSRAALPYWGLKPCSSLPPSVYAGGGVLLVGGRYDKRRVGIRNLTDGDSIVMLR